MYYKLKSYVIGILLASLMAGCQSDESSVQPLIDAEMAQILPDRRLAHLDIQGTQTDSIILLTGESTDRKLSAELIDQLRSYGYSLVDSIKQLPIGIDPYAIVVNSVANVRSKPGHSQELSTQVLLGYILRVYKMEDNWYYVQTPDGYLGWVDAGAIQIINDQKLEVYSIIPKVIYTEVSGKIFSDPRLNSSSITDVTAGAILQFKGLKGAFTRVKLADGRQGYVLSEFTKDARAYFGELNFNEQNIIKEAIRYTGHPYLWGGSSPKGMDCSGFTQHVYRMYNRVLYRDASQQFRQGIELDVKKGDWSTLLPGDLLFFGRPAKGDQGPKVTHVAIYIGDGEMIHSTGRVKVESLDPDSDNFAKKRYDSFVGARRIISDPNIPHLDTTQYYGVKAI